MRSVTSIAVLAIVAMLSVSGCRMAPIADIRNNAYSAVPDPGGRLTRENYRTAIMVAGARRGWEFTPLGEGHLEGRVLVRGKHTVVVDVYYSDVNYSITYKDSSNMRFDPVTRQIHPNYNSWIRLLSQDIQSEVRAMRAAVL